MIGPALPASLADRVLAGDPRAVARAISVIEDESARSAGAGAGDFRAHRSRPPHRRHRSARRGQEHARGSAGGGVSGAPDSPSA